MLPKEIVRKGRFSGSAAHGVSHSGKKVHVPRTDPPCGAGAGRGPAVADRAICLSRRVHLIPSYRSQCEDWILTMVAAKPGGSFLSENATTFAGRRPAPPVAAFIDAVERHGWSSGLMAAIDEPSGCG